MSRTVVFIVALLLMTLPAVAEDVSVTVNKDINPHLGKGKCGLCHVASEDALDSWFTFSSTKREMKLDLNAVCQQCHGVEFGHGVGKWTKTNRDHLPMDSQGKIACAVTCHNMHGTSSDSHQNKFHLRAPSMKLCLSCHDR